MPLPDRAQIGPFRVALSAARGVVRHRPRWSSRGLLEIAKAPAATGVPGAVMGIPAVLIDDGTRRRALLR